MRPLRSAHLFAAALLLWMPSVVDAQRTLSLPRTAIIVISVPSGRVEVRGWDRAELSIEGNSAFEAARTTSGAQVRRVARNTGGDGVLRIRVPSGSRVVLELSSGNAEVSEVEGDVEVRSTSGDVTLRRIGGRTIVNTISGDLRVSGASADVQVKTVSGDVEIDGVRGDVDITTTSGDVALRDARVRSLRIATLSGDVTFAGTLQDRARNTISTHSGDVRLHVADDARLQIDLRTFNGRISSRAPLVLLPSSGRSGSESTQRLQLGSAGGPTIDITTFTGDITLVRNGARDNN
jgi:DUF4097 and DUF4098 domain-containing protein YvlB